jgi:hypothetical protein
LHVLFDLDTTHRFVHYESASVEYFATRYQ